MRKNVLVAALLGLSVAGLAACSGGNETKVSEDNTASMIESTAMNTSATEEAQAPLQTADASTMNNETPAADASDSSTVPAASDNSTAPAASDNSTAPAGSDNSTAPAASDNNTAPAADAGTTTTN